MDGRGNELSIGVIGGEDGLCSPNSNVEDFYLGKAGLYCPRRVLHWYLVELVSSGSGVMDPHVPRNRISKSILETWGLNRRRSPALCW